jgi:hypothetical protein
MRTMLRWARVVVRMAGALVCTAVLAPEPGARGAFADERPRTSSAVQVPAQGGGGVEPVPGAPPSVAPSLESRPVPATLGPAPRLSADAARSSLRAVSTADGEATLEIDGVPETVRPGSRLGRDTVKSVSPGRIVLDRSATAKEPAALVIVTFDEKTGRAKTRVFWATDPTTPVAPEVKRP